MGSGIIVEESNLGSVAHECAQVLSIVVWYDLSTFRSRFPRRKGCFCKTNNHILYFWRCTLMGCGMIVEGMTSVFPIAYASSMRLWFDMAWVHNSRETSLSLFFAEDYENSIWKQKRWLDMVETDRKFENIITPLCRMHLLANNSLKRRSCLRKE